jgi:hypothetical protein
MRQMMNGAGKSFAGINPQKTYCILKLFKSIMLRALCFQPNDHVYERLI